MRAFGTAPRGTDFRCAAPHRARPGRAVARRVREDHQGVGGDQMGTGDQQRVHVDLGDLGVVGGELRHGQQDVTQLVGVDAREAAQRAEQALARSSATRAPDVRLVERRQGERHVGDRLREDATQAERDDRAELLVATQADQQFAVVRHELLDEHALIRPPRRPVDDAVVGGPGGGCVPDVELHQADVALVQDVRPERLQHGGPAERLHCRRRLLCAVDDCACRRRNPVHARGGLWLPVRRATTALRRALSGSGRGRQRPFRPPLRQVSPVGKQETVSGAWRVVVRSPRGVAGVE